MSMAHVPRQERGQRPSARDSTQVLIDSHAAKEWDDLISEFVDVSYDQTAAFSNLRWGEGRLGELVLVEHGEPVAGARIAILTQPG